MASRFQTSAASTRPYYCADPSPSLSRHLPRGVSRPAVLTGAGYQHVQLCDEFDPNYRLLPRRQSGDYELESSPPQALVRTLYQRIPYTGASRHVTGIRESIVWDYWGFPQWENQVRISPVIIIDSTGERITPIEIDNLHSMIVLQHVLHVLSCG